MLETNIPFSLRLQIIRKNKRMTQEELATKAGLSQIQISNYETDRHTPSLTKLKTLCKILDVTATELLGY